MKVRESLGIEVVYKIRERWFVRSGGRGVGRWEIVRLAWVWVVIKGFRVYNRMYVL